MSSIDLVIWLGPSAPADFDSIAEIEDYFTIEHMREMFGNEEEKFDEDELQMACLETIAQWETARLMAHGKMSAAGPGEIV